MCASKALCGGDETQEEPCNLEPCPGKTGEEGLVNEGKSKRL